MNYSCIWLRILEDRGDFRLVHIVEILKHFDIICELPKEASDKVVYFIPWFVADEEPEEVHRGWNSMEEWETRVSEIKLVEIASFSILAVCYAKFPISSH